jgi:hypothetical protein
MPMASEMSLSSANQRSIPGISAAARAFGLLPVKLRATAESGDPR